MTEIIMSIQPQWVAKILDLSKRWELRKTVPKQPEPFRVFIYQTGNVGVVGEFTCDYTEDCLPEDLTEKWLAGTEVSLEQAIEYAGGSPVCKWRIRSLIEYPEPRPLERYGLERAPQSWCYVPEGVSV